MNLIQTIKRIFKMQTTLSVAEKVNALLPDNTFDGEIDQNVFTLEDTLRIAVEGLLNTVYSQRGQAVLHFEVVTPDHLIAYFENGYSKPLNINNIHEFYLVS